MNEPQRGAETGSNGSKLADERDRRAEYAFRNFLGESDSVRRAIELGCRVADRPSTTVLLRGETGTGKELFARGIHYAGEQASEPFVPINCAAIPENLLESELFGHEKGAFTGASAQKRGLMELAGSGTVFLDEISEMPPNLQPKLLRVVEEKCLRRVGGVEERQIMCRIIAATNRDLAAAVADGLFREDLFYRLNVFHVDLPPLRARAGDIEPLARHFAELLCREQGLVPKRISPAAAELLRAHEWPGNVRELKNTIERAIILADGDWIEPQHIILQQRSNIPAAQAAEAKQAAGWIAVPAAGLKLAEAERQLLEITIRLTNGNQTRAAQLLGISRPTVNRKLRDFGLI